MENLKIKKIVNRILKEHLSNSQIISENPIVPRLLNRFLGSNLVSRLESSMGDDVVRGLESLFISGERNIIQRGGVAYLKSASGSEIRMTQIQDAVELVLSGRRSADDVARFFPSKLEDGTEFRTIFTAELKKPRTSTIINTASHIPPTGGWPGAGSNVPPINTPAPMLPLPSPSPYFPPIPNNVDLGSLYQLSQYRGKTASQILGRLKNRFPKAPESELNKIADNLYRAGAASEMEFNMMLQEAMDGFLPQYDKIMAKPTAKTILGKIWDKSPKWIRFIITVALIVEANELFDLTGVNIGDFTRWLTSSMKSFASEAGKGAVEGIKKPVDGSEPTDNKKPRPY